MEIKRDVVNKETGEIDLQVIKILDKPFMKVKQWLEFREIEKKIVASQEKLDLISTYVSKGVSVKWAVENILGQKKYEGE